MADREWFEVDGMDHEFANLEAAAAYAERAAGDSDRYICITKCTRATVRRYKRRVTVTAEDVTPSA